VLGAGGAAEGVVVRVLGSEGWSLCPDCAMSLCWADVLVPFTNFDSWMWNLEPSSA
jgi:hypothetical protein